MNQNPIPPEIFFNHLQKLRQTWHEKNNHQMDSIILINGKSSSSNQKTIAIMGWFLAGYNLADTIIFITKKNAIVYTSDRKINFLKNLKEHTNAKKVGLSFQSKKQQNKIVFQKIWNDIHQQVSQPRVGMLLTDLKTGIIAQQFEKFLKTKNHEAIQVNSLFNQCFMAKDIQQNENLKKSAKVSCYFEKKFIREVQVIIDGGKSVKHSTISRKIEQMIQNEAQLKKCTLKLSSENKLAIVKQNIDIGPVISLQSGGSYTTKLFAESDDREVRSDCIMLALGTLYRGYNSYIGRTLLIDPTDEQKSIYKKIQTLSKIIIQNIRVGVKIGTVYSKAKQFLQDNLPKIDIPKSFGFGIGVYLCENNLQITENNNREINIGFSFLINCTFPNIKYDTKKGTRIFGIQLIDMVIIGEKGQQLITNDISKNLADISYSLDDDQPVVNRQSQSKPLSYIQNNIENQLGEGRARRKSKNQNAFQKLKNQKQRNQHQNLLKQQKLDELKERVNESFTGYLKKQKTVDLTKLQCYKNREDLPKDLKKNMIYVDNKSCCILLPIYGLHVPFHIHILKSVVKNDEGKFASLRFNFFLPNSVTNLNFPKYLEPFACVKQIVFRSQQLARIAELEKQVKALQKKVKTDMSEKHAKEDIVEQQKISLNKGKRPMLRDLYARPGIGQKKMKGSLQCHFNGFKYSTIKGEHIDISFSNIKIAFFQPCEKEIIAAIHFHLNQPIMVGKKKIADIQFYSEGGPNAEDVVGRGRGHGDEEDDEQRQKQSRKKLDKDFFAWIKACQEYIAKNFDFQLPNRRAGFYGTPFKTNSLLQPTKSCLINITEMPFFVICLEDIEVACFERMYANIKSFDVTLVQKDYEQNIRINSIPIKDVERVKDWLDEKNIIFYDLGKNLNWAKFLAGIRSDFKKFVEDGAWTAWDSDDQQQQLEIAEGDSEFSALSEELEEQSENSEQSESDFEKQQDNNDSEDDEDSEDEELSEKGLSWDEMEERAEIEDRERVRREIQKQKDFQHQKR